MKLETFLITDQFSTVPAQYDKPVETPKSTSNRELIYLEDSSKIYSLEFLK